MSDGGKKRQPGVIEEALGVRVVNDVFWYDDGVACGAVHFMTATVNTHRVPMKALEASTSIGLIRGHEIM